VAAICRDYSERMDVELRDAEGQIRGLRSELAAAQQRASSAELLTEIARDAHQATLRLLENARLELAHERELHSEALARVCAEMRAPRGLAALHARVSAETGVVLHAMAAVTRKSRAPRLLPTRFSAVIRTDATQPTRRDTQSIDVAVSP